MRELDLFREKTILMLMDMKFIKKGLSEEKKLEQSISQETEVLMPLKLQKDLNLSSFVI